MAPRKIAAADMPEQEVMENKRPEQKAAPAEREPEKQIAVVYIGPSLPYGKLRSSMVLRGTEGEIGDFLADVREKYPEVDHLTVPPEQLTQALEKVGRKGTILHKYYEDMLAKSRESRRG